ncbi:MAG: translation initiation factor IF-2 [Chlamydiales bacterium]|nr:translation initiation factor IF-2 [Chlamydiales bacterium]
MAKNLKLKIKNTQLAKAAGLDKFKAKLSGEKQEKEAKPKTKKAQPPKEKAVEAPVETEEPKTRRIRAKSKSAFAKEDLPSPKDNDVEENEESSTSVEEAAATMQEPPPQIVEEKVKAEAEEEQKNPEKLGPTGRHIKDILPAKREKPKEGKAEDTASKGGKTKEEPSKKKEEKEESGDKKILKKGKKVRDFKDLKPAKRQQPKSFDARDRQGLSEGDEGRWRKKRPSKQFARAEDHEIIRPTELKVRIPITVKELAAEMKLKASELIQKLFLHGMTYTVNDPLEDETTVQYIGDEFGCRITIDRSEAERIQITAHSIREEIDQTDPEKLKIRPPVVAFMGHVDHGKTSLIDSIRKSNIVAGEAGAITQHIGAFRCKTPVGDLTVLDTPGHEAFSAMRARGAEVTDIVVLVVAGDEGLRDQTVEAIHHAKAAGVTIVVAINKCDKPNFNPENVYRELSEIELLPEAWGGATITVNTSAVTGQGISDLLEMLALQAEVLELRANPEARARGTVLESELHKGLGNVTTVLVQNGTLHHGDALVFERDWGRVKTMHDEHGNLLKDAGPSTPIEITGLSGLPSAGDPFIVVKSEKEAKNIVETREIGREQRALQQRKLPTLEKFLQEGKGAKKILKLILRADVQGSAEALKTSILKIESDKAEADIIFMGVGEISESDVQLAAASNAIIIGFHTAIESHAEPLIKELGVTVRMFDVIYHAIEEVKALMLGLLDKISEEKETGTAEVKATFKSSHLGVIAGCMVTGGVIHRNNKARILRDGQEVWKGNIASIKREKEDVKEIKKGFECGILLEGFSDVQVDDVIQAYEIIFRTQEL